MANTPYLGLPEISGSQSNKSTTHNDALQVLDIIVQRGIVDKDLSAPPGSPTTGAAYIVASGGSGAWSGHDGDIAYYRSGWVFIDPWEGITLWVNDEDLHYTYSGSAWTRAYVAQAAKVRVATTANITIATALNNGDSLDGVTLATGDLVLVKDQGSPEQNGVYVVAASPARAPAFATYNDHPATLIGVMEGTTNADTTWFCTSNQGGTLGSTAITFGSYPAVVAATAAQYWANTANKVLKTDGVWSSADYVSLTDAATISVDFSAGINFTVTLGDNRTLGNPSNTKNGQAGVIVINQDGSGNRTLAYSSNWKFAAGATPALSTAASARDLLYYQVISSTFIYGTLVKGIA